MALINIDNCETMQCGMTDQLESNLDKVMYGEMYRETKRRRDDYQEMVMCPQGETNQYMIGLNTWRDFDSVVNKIGVASDMGLMELMGYLTPVVAIGALGYFAARK